MMKMITVAVAVLVLTGCTTAGVEGSRLGLNAALELSDEGAGDDKISGWDVFDALATGALDAASLFWLR